MEKIETPVVAGVGGVAILAALLSVFGGGNKEAPQISSEPTQAAASAEASPAASALPNQDGPWRAVCQEYAPYVPPPVTPKGKRAAQSTGTGKVDLTAVSRGYTTVREPSGIEGASEITITNPTGVGKIIVHKLLVGDLPSCIPPDQLGKIRFVVATLPDPDKTDMRLEFDRYVTALEEAAALRGYHYSGYWFPWRPRDNNPAPKKEDEVEAQLLREEQPGVLLFHNDLGERLFLFVVGETATSGINRMQMAQALAYRQQMIDCYDGRTVPQSCPSEITPVHHERDTISGPLLIAGPHFSGALPSLWEVLQNSILIHHPYETIVIDSPDASSEPLIEAFRKKCKTAYSCSFRSISINATQKDQAAADYLGSIGYMDHVAELVEDESGFGDSEGQSASPFVLKLTYPRELSAVRTLSDKQSEQVAASGSKFLSLSTSPSTLKLSGGEALERDRPFVYANDDEATEVSNALADDVRVLLQKEIQCIVIGASNPLDRIYLLEYFHDRLPNVRLVVVDADELEINHPQFIDLTGTITISSLPAIPQTVKLANANGDPSKPSHLAFASVAAEEEFLATAMILGNEPIDELSQDNGFTVSIVGENGFEFVPYRNKSLVEEKDLGDKEYVDLFGHESFSDAKLRTKISIQLEQSGRIPRSFIALSWLVFICTFVHVKWVVKAEHPISIFNKITGDGCVRPYTSYWEGLKNVYEFLARVKKVKHPIALLKRLADRQYARLCTSHWAYGSRTGDSIHDYGRVYNLFVLNNQLFLLNLLLLCAAPELSSVRDLSPVVCWFLRFAWVGLFATALLVLFYGGEYLWRVVKAKSVLAWGYWLITIWYLLAGAIFLVLWHAEAQKEWRRMLWLDGGISPVVPIAAVLFGWTLWGLIQARRAKWVAYRKIEPVPSGIGPMSRLHLEFYEKVRQIHGEIDQTSISWRRMVVLFGTVGLAFWWQWTSLRGLEPDPELGRFKALLYGLFPANFHRWFAMWGGIMLLATLILSAYQLYVIWRGLSGLLRRLENTSMKEAFEKLGLDDRVQIKIWDLGKARMRYSEMFVTVKCLRYVSSVEVASAAESALNEYEAADFRNSQANLAQRKTLNNSLNQGFFAAMAILEGNSHVPLGSREETELLRYLALRFVTFIRYVLLQMRNLMWFIVYGYFLACLSVKLYPFQGGKSLADLLGLTFFIVLALLGVMMAGLLRNPMLRSLEDKDSNPAGALRVILHLATVGGVPLLALLAWQFPWIGQIAFSWLRPRWGAVH